MYQRIIAAYRNPDRAAGKTLLANIVKAIGKGVPATLSELSKLGRTLTRNAADALA